MFSEEGGTFDVLLVCLPRDTPAIARLNSAVSGWGRFLRVSTARAGLLDAYRLPAVWAMPQSYLSPKSLKGHVRRMEWSEPGRVQMWVRAEGREKFREEWIWRGEP